MILWLITNFKGALEVLGAFLIIGLISGGVGFAWGLIHQQNADAALMAAESAREMKELTGEVDEAQKRQASVDKAEMTVGAQTAAAMTKTVTLTKTLIEKVPAYVPAEADTRCTINRGFVDVFNAAAAGIELQSPGTDSGSGPDGAATAFTLSDVARTTVINDGIDHGKDNQIVGLQAAIKAYQAATGH